MVSVGFGNAMMGAVEEHEGGLMRITMGRKSYNQAGISYFHKNLGGSEVYIKEKQRV